MDPIYPRFATTDPSFYDDPRRRVVDRLGRYEVDAEVAWTEWDDTDDGHWRFWRPVDARLPDQGWKIHASATPTVAADLLRTVSTFCHSRRLPFKHLVHRHVLWSVNGKEADRTASGKFITIYPSDEAQLHDALVGLDGLVGGMPGPYVLTDLRWNSGPLSVRYGAFTRQLADIDGRRVAAVRAPDGTLVADVRSTQFVVPEWASLPPALVAQRDALGTEPPWDLPRVTGALHHSNAGGVYEAIDHDGAVVVLKEARPHAGLTPDGRDALTRLRDEERALSCIDAPSVVRARRTVEAHGHRFLVMDRVDGVALNKAVVMRHPLVRASATADEIADYRDWALRIIGGVEVALGAVHAAGYSHGDLHPGNVLVTPDDGVVLLDFEMARPLTENVPAIIGAPGFVPPDGRGGTSLDRYALACIRLFIFAPLTALIAHDRDKARELCRWVERRFEVDSGWAARVILDLDLFRNDRAAHVEAGHAIEEWDSDASGALAGSITAIAAALATDADLARRDRLWPGDPAQFGEPAAALAHGAGGVLVALHDAGGAAPDGAMEWFQRDVERELADPLPRLGLCDGLAGVLWAQRRLGLHGAAARVLDRLRVASLDEQGADLSSGLSGLGLVLLAESHSDASLRPLVDRIAERVADLFDERARPGRSTAATGCGGLLRGTAGIALFASKLFAVTGDERHLRLAEQAVDDDLSVCVWLPDGSLQLDEGWRTMPYLGSGSAGVGLALLELLPMSMHRDRYIESLNGIRRAASVELVAQSGLLEGRSGLIHFLIALARAGHDTPESAEALARHVRLLRLHAVRRAEGLGFPGNGLMRLSCDLATGSAGVLSALTAYRDHLAGSSRGLASTATPSGVPTDSLPAPVGNNLTFT
ncbi:class III lanthionine synthetase LanKC [uncultured Microbacterium sp.]|uniref:class III lanthionine synthetase LanKC n=1 Tax=uncultured Microbacterium sp. TaxID=191216 RepID=UPI0035CC55FF